MASKYATEHDGALADVTDAGSAITFSRSVAGTISDSTDVETGSSTSTIAGYAVEQAGDRDTYRAMGLTHATAVTLFFTPSTIGSLPLAGDTATWGTQGVTVQSTESLAPDGVAIAAIVVCRR